MNAKMMEGLVGASMNAKLSDTPMKVYEQASREGDTAKMERALGFAGECTEKAEQYQEKVDQGREEEKKAEREQAKVEQEEALEEIRNERKEAEKSVRAGRGESADTVEISEAGKAALQERPAETAAPVEGDPVTYTESGEIAAPPQPEPTVSFSA